ncbi:hypothetical protein BJ875DRAFT_463078 [Amylocarpus encephaloides]|uniref:Secreted protein n=1 Tax=Amylocarpus encephaloides TaxID=45428 RepID=A0A9P7YHG9_9HELO|nr:hypothetical protein BJ875DRAFT_463078 [Amylocarpus encephaloides]
MPGLLFWVLVPRFYYLLSHRHTHGASPPSSGPRESRAGSCDTITGGDAPWISGRAKWTLPSSFQYHPSQHVQRRICISLRQPFSRGHRSLLQSEGMLDSGGPGQIIGEGECL